jgi:hypothetical protein
MVVVLAAASVLERLVHVDATMVAGPTAAKRRHRASSTAGR